MRGPPCSRAIALTHTAKSRRSRNTKLLAEYRCGQGPQILWFVAGFGANFDPLPSRKFLYDLADPGDLKNFIPSQGQGLRTLIRQKLQRQNAHSDKIGPMNALVALGDDGLNPEQQRPFRCPIA